MKIWISFKFFKISRYLFGNYLSLAQGFPKIQRYSYSLGLRWAHTDTRQYRRPHLGATSCECKLDSKVRQTGWGQTNRALTIAKLFSFSLALPWPSTEHLSVDPALGKPALWCYYSHFLFDLLIWRIKLQNFYYQACYQGFR